MKGEGVRKLVKVGEGPGEEDGTEFDWRGEGEGEKERDPERVAPPPPSCGELELIVLREGAKEGEAAGENEREGGEDTEFESIEVGVTTGVPNTITV